MKKKHAEGKLKAIGNIILADGMGVAEGGWVASAAQNETGEANAARLALAWNCHDELVSVASAFVQSMRLAGVKAAHRSNDPLEELHFRASAILTKATAAD